MCGIVGFVRNTNNAFHDVCESFEQMWWGTQLRGLNGSGIFQVDKDGEVDFQKSAFTPDYSAYDKAIAPMLHNVDTSPFTVAHCRAATKVPNKADEKYWKKNAHPFQHGNITLVHNGVFTYVGQDHNDKHEVDSESFTNAVDDLGIQEALKRAYGAYALIFYDKATGKLNIARNQDRPLFRVVHPTGHFYISEPELAVWILKRNRMAPPSAIIEVPPEKLIQYAPWDLNFEVSDIETRSSYPKHGRFRYNDGCTLFENEDDDDVIGPITTTGPINKDISLAEVIEKAGRFCWKDSVWAAKFRKSSQGFTPKLGKDYEDFLRNQPKSEEPPKEEQKVVPFRPTEFGMPAIQEESKDGSITRLFHDDLGFSIIKGNNYVFSVQEIIEHKTFVGIIGRVGHTVAAGRVTIVGNFNEKAKTIKASNKMLEGKVSSITRYRERGVKRYTVTMADIKFSEHLDIRRLIIEDEKKANEKAPQAVLLISKDRDGETVSLADLVTCPSCKTITKKNEMVKYTKELFKDVEGRTTTQITVNVCRNCYDEAACDFDAFYQRKYLPAVADKTKGMQ